MKEYEMVGTYSTREEYEKWIQYLCQKTRSEENHLENLGVDEKKLKWILKK
jgi:hypothetical protein